MSGPNSAPNGDARLVKGYPGQDFVWVKVDSKRDERYPGYWKPLRDYLADKGRLETGKTSGR